MIGAYRPEHLIPVQTANDCSHSGDSAPWGGGIQIVTDATTTPESPPPFTLPDEARESAVVAPRASRQRTRRHR